MSLFHFISFIYLFEITFESHPTKVVLREEVKKDATHAQTLKIDLCNKLKIQLLSDFHASIA